MNVIKSELSDEKPHFCAKCDQLIQDRYFLKALNLFWHEDCLKCGCCNCRLGDVGSTLYTRENFLLCKSDYMRLYGNTGLCSACNKLIPAFEMVMRAKRNVYHLECFACQQCSHRFCVGDRFYLYENKILCESDYDEKRTAAGLAGYNNNNNNNNLHPQHHNHHHQLNNNTNNNNNNLHNNNNNNTNLTKSTKNNLNFNGINEYTGYSTGVAGVGGGSVRRSSDHQIIVR